MKKPNITLIVVLALFAYGCETIIDGSKKSDHEIGDNPKTGIVDLPKVLNKSSYQEIYFIEKYVVNQIEPVISVDNYKSEGSILEANIVYRNSKKSRIKIEYSNKNYFFAKIDGDTNFELVVNLRSDNSKLHYFKSEQDFATIEYVDDIGTWQLTEGSYQSLEEFNIKNEKDVISIFVPVISRLTDLKYKSIDSLKENKSPSLFEVSIECLNSEYELNSTTSCTGNSHSIIKSDQYKSICCKEALDEVQSQCSNNWCIGCCWSACDAACAWGDYMCHCTANGQACSEGDSGGGGGGDCPSCPIPE